jgi:hypothetical protein
MEYQHRKPYESVTEVFQIPVALFEVLSLVDEASINQNNPQVLLNAKTLLRSIINTALSDPESWLKIQTLSVESLSQPFLKEISVEQQTLSVEKN